MLRTYLAALKRFGKREAVNSIALAAPDRGCGDREGRLSAVVGRSGRFGYRETACSR
jgi:hypothetical protein